METHRASLLCANTHTVGIVSAVPIQEWPECRRVNQPTGNLRALLDKGEVRRVMAASTSRRAG